MDTPALAIGDGALGFWAALGKPGRSPTANAAPIESSFAAIRHRTIRTKHCVPRNTLLSLVFTGPDGREVLAQARRVQVPPRGRRGEAL